MDKNKGSIETNTEIHCRIGIDEFALIATHSLVSKNIGKFELWFGIPVQRNI